MLPSIPLPENPSQYYTPIFTCALQAILTLRYPHPNPLCNYSLPIHATCTLHCTLLDLNTQIIFGEQYRSLSSSLCSFLHSPDTFSLLYRHMLVNTTISNTISLRFSRNTSDMVSYPHKTAGEVIFRYILIFKFLAPNCR